MSVAALVQYVGEVLGRSHALFGQPPDASGIAASARLDDARRLLVAGRRRFSSQSGDFATGYDGFTRRAATAALPAIYKAHKWFVTRGDLDYTALWVLAAAPALAKIEVIGAGLLADREVIPQAMMLNPAFFKTIYADLLNTRKTRKAVQAALDAVDAYVARRAATLFGPVIDQSIVSPHAMRPHPG